MKFFLDRQSQKVTEQNFWNCPFDEKGRIRAHIEKLHPAKGGCCAHSSLVNSVTFNSKGDLIVSGAYGDSIRLWQRKIYTFDELEKLILEKKNSHKKSQSDKSNPKSILYVKKSKLSP